jgi:cytochrome c-type biogenesis protein CcmH
MVMGGFVFAAALLALLAVAFAVSVLWQRAPKLALAIALGVPLVAGGLYLLVGRPAALDPANVVPPKTMEAAVAQLEREIADEPESFENLVVLARARMALGQYAEAAPLYRKAIALNPADSDVAVEYAETALRTSADRHFPPAVVPLLETAVAKNPANQRALFFLGLQRLQADRPAEAAALWERLLPLLPPDAAGALRPQVVAARAAAGLPPLPEAAFTGAPGVDIVVDIDPTLAKLAAPGDALFVFAHAAEGKGPPLAAKRVPLDAFPVRLRLTDADGPMPAAKLSSATRVLVQARLSKTGQATGSTGDLEADPVLVTLPARDAAQLMLNRTRP